MNVKKKLYNLQDFINIYYIYMTAKYKFILKQDQNTKLYS